MAKPFFIDTPGPDGEDWPKRTDDTTENILKLHAADMAKRKKQNPTPPKAARGRRVKRPRT